MSGMCFKFFQKEKKTGRQGKEREEQGMCVCVYPREERKRGTGCVCVCVCVWKWGTGGVCVCVCVCVYPREGREMLVIVESGGLIYYCVNFCSKS